MGISGIQKNSVSLPATLTPEDSSDAVTWANDNISMAAVDANVTVAAVENGTATITATAGSSSATCTVAVQTYSSSGGGSTPSTVEDSTIKGGPTTAEKGDTVTIPATANKGYKVDEVIVADKNGKGISARDKGSGKYTTTYPSTKSRTRPLPSRSNMPRNTVPNGRLRAPSQGQ